MKAWSIHTGESLPQEKLDRIREIAKKHDIEFSLEELENAKLVLLVCPDEVTVVASQEFTRPALRFIEAIRSEIQPTKPKSAAFRRVAASILLVAALFAVLVAAVMTNASDKHSSTLVWAIVVSLAVLSGVFGWSQETEVNVTLVTQPFKRAAKWAEHSWGRLAAMFVLCPMVGASAFWLGPGQIHEFPCVTSVTLSTWWYKGARTCPNEKVVRVWAPFGTLNPFIEALAQIETHMEAADLEQLKSAIGRFAWLPASETETASAVIGALESKTILNFLMSSQLNTDSEAQAVVKFVETAIMEHKDASQFGLKFAGAAITSLDNLSPSAEWARLRARILRAVHDTDLSRAELLAEVRMTFHKLSDRPGIWIGQHELLNSEYTRVWPKKGAASLPATSLAWYEARAIAEWLGARLPTPQELAPMIGLSNKMDAELAEWCAASPNQSDVLALGPNGTARFERWDGLDTIGFRLVRSFPYQKPHPKDLLAYFPFSHDFRDSGTGWFVGAAQGGATVEDTSLLDSSNEGALVFDGKDDYLVIEDTGGLDFGDDNFSISIWVEFSSDDREQVIVEKYVETIQKNGNEEVSGWTLTKLALGDILFAGANPIENEVIIQGTPPTRMTVASRREQTAWHHVCVTRMENTFSLFWDGVLLGSKPFRESLNLGTTASIKVGKRGGPEDGEGSNDTRKFFLHGRVADLMFYRRCLDTTEIELIFRKQRPQR